LDQRVVPAMRGVLGVLPAALLRVKPRGLLRVDEPHARERTHVAEVFFGAVAPHIKILDWLEPARVVDAAGEFREPRPQSVRDAVDRPEANLGGVLHRILPAIRLLEPDAENSDDRFAAHRGAK